MGDGAAGNHGVAFVLVVSDAPEVVVYCDVGVPRFSCLAPTDAFEPRSVASADLGVPRVLGCRAPAQVVGAVVCVVAIDMVDASSIVGVGVVGLADKSVDVVAPEVTSGIAAADN